MHETLLLFPRETPSSAHEQRIMNSLAAMELFTSWPREEDNNKAIIKKYEI